MLLYALDEFFYIFDQVKCHRGIDEKLVVAYEILSLAVLRCTEHQGWLEKTGVLDAVPLVNLKDTHHLECLTWAVYDGALLVGSHPELPGECQWCTVLAGIFRHIYKGRDKVAHCPPIPWHHGAASREQRWLVKGAGRMPCAAGRMMDVEPGHRDQGAAPGFVLRCQAKRGGPDTLAVPYPTHHHRGTPVQGNSSPQVRTPHPSSPRL